MPTASTKTALDPRASEAFFLCAQGLSSGQGRGAYMAETAVQTWLAA
jgi:hypothetical protein